MRLRNPYKPAPIYPTRAHKVRENIEGESAADWFRREVGNCLRYRAEVAVCVANVLARGGEVTEVIVDGLTAKVNYTYDPWLPGFPLPGETRRDR